ncbi:calcium-binding protein [Micromonospora sp. NPDC005172]|uniref:calcium-binding protein n=1 Tax=Micromonospora sp. NPDC005172 TaxID=3156867 RepID=UPI0033A3F7A0
MAALSRAELDALVDEATVDAYDDDEQLNGLYSMLEEHLTVPFTTRVLGVEVTVRRVDLRHGVAVAICHRGQIRQAIGILDLPLPEPSPPGAEWIEAYRHWAKGVDGE